MAQGADVHHSLVILGRQLLTTVPPPVHRAGGGRPTKYVYTVCTHPEGVGMHFCRTSPVRALHVAPTLLGPTRARHQVLDLPSVNAWFDTYHAPSAVVFSYPERPVEDKSFSSSLDLNP